MKWRLLRPRGVPFGGHEQRLSGPVVLRYFLFQIPGWALAVFMAWLLPAVIAFDPVVAWAVAGAWIAKDFLLLPFLWPFYVPDPSSNAHSPVGARGIAVERLAPVGYVRVGSELWRAEVDAGGQPIERGATVRVIAVRDLTLRVRSIDE